MTKALAIFLMLAATLACLVMVTMLMAGGANSTPKQISQLKMMMIGTGVTWLLGVGGSIVAMCVSRDGLAAWLAGVPIVVVVVGFAVLFLTEW